MYQVALTSILWLIDCLLALMLLCGPIRVAKKHFSHIVILTFSFLRFQILHWKLFSSTSSCPCFHGLLSRRRLGACSLRRCSLYRSRFSARGLRRRRFSTRHLRRRRFRTSTLTTRPRRPHRRAILTTRKIQHRRTSNIHTNILTLPARPHKLRPRRSDILTHITTHQRHHLSTLAPRPRHIDIVHVTDKHFGGVLGTHVVVRLVALVDDDRQVDVFTCEGGEGDVAHVPVSAAGGGGGAGGAAEGFDARAVLGGDHGYVRDEDVGHDVLSAGVLA